MPENKFDDELAFTMRQPQTNAALQPLKLHHLAHDLRGPLNSVLGFAELLLEGIEGPINEIQAEDLTAIRQSAKNLLRLINNIVDLSKLNHNRLSLTFGPVNLNNLIQNIIINEFKASQLEVVVELPEIELFTWGDAERVSHMIEGLIHFMRRQKPSQPVKIRLTDDDATITIQVNISDNWLTLAQIELLFAPIVLVSETGRTELGLGGVELPLARLLAGQHNGQLWLESDPIAGTTFFLKLPLSKPSSKS